MTIIEAILTNPREAQAKVTLSNVTEARWMDISGNVQHFSQIFAGNGKTDIKLKRVEGAFPPLTSKNLFVEYDRPG